MEEVSDMEDASTERATKEQLQEINESGIGVDLNESTSCNNHTVCNTASSFSSVTEMPFTPIVSSKANYSMNKLSPDASEELSFDCSGMKKDDSGIYSEKSPVCGIVKEMSDGDLTESITESFEENASLEQKCKNNSGLNDVDTFEIESVEAVVRVKQVADLNHALVKEKAKQSDNSNACNINTKDTEELCDTETFSLNSSDPQIEVLEDIAFKNSEGSDVYKPASFKGAKPLVDYDSSDNERKESGDPRTDKAHKCFRKRKSDDNSDNESTGENDGTPVLLRHAEIGEGEIAGHSGLESEDNSDASDADLRAKSESSESEADDTPMDLSQFGPPKHKWRALFDLRDRERGYPIRSEPGYFRKKIQGSLQMVQRFDLQYKMEQHHGCVNALHFNRIGTLLASGSDDLNIVIWNWIRNKPALVYDSGHRSNVFQSKFMPFSGDCHVVSCARDGQIRLADLSSTGVCKGTKKLAQHRGAAHKLALEMDSPHVFLSCGEDAITFEIDLRCDKANKLVTTKENDRKVALYSIHSNPCNSNEFVVSGRDHYIRIYDKRKINEEVDDGVIKKFCPHHLTTGDKPDAKANVTCACYNHNGTEVLGTYNDEDIYLFSNTHSDGANYIHKYTGHRNNQTVKGVNFYGPESEFIVSGSDCGHIFLWDKATENIVKYMAGDDGGVINVLEPHPFSPVLATSGLDHDIKIWAPTGEYPFNLTGLKKLTKRNSREREQDRSSEGGMVDGAMLWYLMHHLRRRRRHREREARRASGESPAEDDDDDDDDDSDTESDESPHSDSDSDSGPHERIQCAPS